MVLLVVNVKQWKQLGRGRGRSGSEVKKSEKGLPEFFRCEVNRMVTVLTEHAESPPHQPLSSSSSRRSAAAVGPR